MLPSARSWGPCPSVPIAKWGDIFLKRREECGQDFEVWTRGNLKKKSGEAQLGVDTLRFQHGFFSKFRALEWKAEDALNQAANGLGLT